MVFTYIYAAASAVWKFSSENLRRSTGVSSFFIFSKGWKFYKKKDSLKLDVCCLPCYIRRLWVVGWMKGNEMRLFWIRIPSYSFKGIEFLEKKVAHNEIISCANNFYEKSSWKNFAHQLIVRWQLWPGSKCVTIFFFFLLGIFSIPPIKAASNGLNFSAFHLTLLVPFRIRNKAIMVFDSIGLPLGGSE